MKQTDDFLSQLNDLSQRDSSKTNINNGSEWSLVLIDCDDIESLIQQEKITIEDVQNSIHLLETSIYRLIKNNSNNDNKDNDEDHEIFGYHLGGDLFALFINDNYNMDKSKKIVEHLMKIMRNEDESSLTISVGIGIRTLNTLSNPKKDSIDFKELQREWVLRAHCNLLRAKENGKNCYFDCSVCVYIIFAFTITLPFSFP